MNWALDLCWHCSFWLPTLKNYLQSTGTTHAWNHCAESVIKNLQSIFFTLYNLLRLGQKIIFIFWRLTAKAISCQSINQSLSVCEGVPMQWRQFFNVINKKQVFFITLILLCLHFFSFPHFYCCQVPRWQWINLMSK